MPEIILDPDPALALISLVHLSFQQQTAQPHGRTGPNLWIGHGWVDRAEFMAIHHDIVASARFLTLISHDRVYCSLYGYLHTVGYCTRTDTYVSAYDLIMPWIHHVVVFLFIHGEPGLVSVGMDWLARLSPSQPSDQVDCRVKQSLCASLVWQLGRSNDRLLVEARARFNACAHPLTALN